MRARGLVRIAICVTTIVMGAAGTARASCDFTDIPAAVAAAASGRVPLPAYRAQAPAAPEGAAVDPSIVGLWHTTFLVDVGGTNVPVQEAFQLWNVGGTEIHNPNVDPRQGNVCLGVWQQAASRTFKLTHRVWAWDTNGGFQGTLHLSETLTLGNGGSTFSGTFTLGIYDPSGAFVTEISGTATGNRIKVGDI